MTTTATQPLPSAANIRQSLPAGFDGGNGNTKLALGDTEIRCPAYVLPIHSELYDVPLPVAGGLVEYVSGDRSDLWGSAGYPAFLPTSNRLMAAYALLTTSAARSLMGCKPCSARLLPSRIKISGISP